MAKNPLVNSGDPGLIPGLGRFHMTWSNAAYEPQLLQPTHPRVRAWRHEKPPQ